MRRISKRRIDEIAEARAIREQFASEYPTCMVPWCQRPACDTHEIASGPGRRQAYQERCAWLRLCRACHNEIQGDWPAVRQLALKAIADLESYDRVRVNQLRGRADNAIDERDVIACLIGLHKDMEVFGRATV